MDGTSRGADRGQVLRAEGISKRFTARPVLDGVDLTIAPGEVHALLGPNGSGKSTLVKVLSGYYEASERGLLELNGTPYPAHPEPHALARLGLRVVHQDLGLIPELSILENVAVAVGYERRLAVIDWASTRRRVRDALDVVGLRRSVNERVTQLAAWERTAVAFARVVYDGLSAVRLLILDEITAALSRDQVVEILAIVRNLRALGAGVLYVTHRFEEVFEIADRVTVLVDAHVAAVGPVSQFSADRLVELVAGHAVAPRSSGNRAARGDVVVEASRLTSSRLRAVSFDIRSGEVCGVIGRAGCGRSALGRAVFGLEQLSSGEVRVNGQALVPCTVHRALNAGVAYLPQDRLREGVLPLARVRENLTLADLPSVSYHGLVSRKREAESARHLVRKYSVLPTDPELFIELLSGGNQQKVVVSRWMTRQRALFVLDEPTEGVDAGARQTIYDFIDECCAAGAAVLLLSSDIDEVVQMCDRVLYMSTGAIEAEISGSDLNVRHIDELLLLGGPRASELASADQRSAPNTGDARRRST
jgi:ribose transport system ATP-binding protein